MLTLEKIKYLLENSENYTNEIETHKLNNKIIKNYPDPSIMGVINLSSDSWYRESVSLTIDSAIEKGIELSSQGADIIDIGAESTLPNADIIDIKKQLKLLLPIIKTLTENNIIVSVETYHKKIIQDSLDSGASIINLTSTVETQEIYEIISDYDAGSIICYIQDGKNPREVNEFSYDEKYFELLNKYFKTEIKKSLDSNNKQIWLDPGLGFYYKNLMDSNKRIAYQMNTLLQTKKIKQHGFPVCHALPHAFEIFQDEVRTAESFFATLAILGETDLLRTHEVKKIKAIKKMMSLI